MVVIVVGNCGGVGGGDEVGDRQASSFVTLPRRGALVLSLLARHQPPCSAVMLRQSTYYDRWP